MIGAVVLIVACLLPWFGAGGGSELPSTEYRAFQGSGILAFLAGLLVLALASLPYAAGRPVGLDAWPAYALLTGLAIVGIALWPFGNDLLSYPAGLLPDRALGFYVAIAGGLVLARATYDIFREPATA